MDACIENSVPAKKEAKLTATISTRLGDAAWGVGLLARTIFKLY